MVSEEFALNEIVSFVRLEFNSGLAEFIVLLDAGKYGGASGLKIVATSPGLHNSEVIFLDASFMTFKNVLLPGFSAIFF